MHRNYWVKQVFIRNLNDVLKTKVSGYVNLIWNEALKKEVSRIALKFMQENDLDDVAFAVQLEKYSLVGISEPVEKFKGIRIIA
jgi:hypothetical protein